MFKNTFILLTFLSLFSCNKPEKTESGTDEKSDNKFETTSIVFKDQFIDGQPINYYLKMPEIADQVLQYYYGNFEVNENSASDTLLHTLIHGSKETIPFYYKCFMNVCKNADSSLDKYLGKYCIELLENNTRYCIIKLRQGYPDYFTGLVANEIYAKDNWEEEINDLFVRLHVNLEKEDPELRKELDLFIVGLRNDIEHMIRE